MRPLLLDGVPCTLPLIALGLEDATRTVDWAIHPQKHHIVPGCTVVLAIKSTMHTDATRTSVNGILHPAHAAARAAAHWFNLSLSVPGTAHLAQEVDAMNDQSYPSNTRSHCQD